MAVSGLRPRKRSYPILILVTFGVPLVGSTLSAAAVGGTSALTFGFVWGLVLGVFAFLFALFPGWLSRRV